MKICLESFYFRVRHNIIFLPYAYLLLCICIEKIKSALKSIHHDRIAVRTMELNIIYYMGI